MSLRELAQSQGTSTSAIYTIFGGKAELIEAIVREAHDSFSAAQREALGAGDSLECLQRLGMAYRRWALDHSSLYLVMFGCPPVSYTHLDVYKRQAHPRDRRLRGHGVLGARDAGAVQRGDAADQAVPRH